MTRIATSLFVVAALLLLVVPAVAKEYNIPILVSDEDDIMDLYYAGNIDEEERDLLIQILQDPLDINEAGRDDFYNLPDITYELADRIIAVRKKKRFSRVSQLKKIEGLTDLIYQQIQPFVHHVPEVKKKKKLPSEVKGKAEFRVVDGIADDDVKNPEMYLKAESRWRNVRAGVLMSMVNGIGPPRKVDYYQDVWKANNSDELLCGESGAGNYNVCGGDFSDQYLYPGEENSASSLEFGKYKYVLRTSGRTYRVPWPKAYASYEGEGWKLLAGSYKIGFGQRLVFDNSGRNNPYGFRPDVHIYTDKESLRADRGLMGVAGTIQLVRSKRVSWDVSPFFSWSRYDRHQNDLNHRTAEDPWGERDSGALVPYIMVSKLNSDRQGSSGLDYWKMANQQLPLAYDELIFGGNTTLHFLSKSHVGVTGYGARVGFHLDDPDTRFTPASGYPDREWFGAVGLDMAFVEVPYLGLFGEAAVTDTGGMGSLIRGVFNRKGLLTELLFRYYGDDFDNPHARGLAAADEWSGNRDRGELGVALDGSWKPVKWFRVKLGTDVWQTTMTKYSYDNKYVTYGEGNQLKAWRNKTFLRTDFYPLPWLQLGAQAMSQDNDLEYDGWTYEATSKGGDVYTKGADIDFNGQRWRYAFDVFLRPHKIFSARLLYVLDSYQQGSLICPKDYYLHPCDGVHKLFRKDHYASALFVVRPMTWLSLKFRAKYEKENFEDLTSDSSEDLSEGEELEVSGGEWVTGYLAADFGPFAGFSFGGKGEVLAFVDDPSKSQEYYWRATLRYVF